METRMQTITRLIWRHTVLLTACVAAHVMAGRNGLIVDTEQGRVSGTRYNFENEKSVVGFLGIPYAKPPVGRYRFRHPQPMERWNHVYDATTLPNSCYQGRDEAFGDFRGSNMWNPNTPVSEDCLYLNVWVPQPKGKNQAVLVWIFGGGFYSGSATLNLYDGRILASKNNIIVVSINYRVGAFGFLSLGDHEAPGNAGLFDQLMGLEWVQQNIKHFGGDPNNVTIFGESAGSVSVSLHLLSPLSKTKFQRAILQSGTANMPWSVMSQEEGMRRSLDLANISLCNDKDKLTSDEIKAVIDCLREKAPSQIVNDQWVSRGIMQFPFLPIVDGAFLIETPEKSLQTRSFKKCDILLGSNSNEASFFTLYELDDLLNLTHATMNHSEFEASMMELFAFYPHYPIENTNVGKKAILFQYSDFIDPNNVSRNLKAIDDAVSECHFLCHVNTFAQAYTEARQNVYMYYFTERYSSNPWPDWMGVLHADEIVFIFGEPFKDGANFTRRERRLSAKIMEYWANFAKSGNPNIHPGRRSSYEWPARSVTGQEYLELNAKLLDDATRTVGRGPRINQCAFWTHYIPQIFNETAPRRWIPPPTPPPAPSMGPVCPSVSAIYSAQSRVHVLNYYLLILLISVVTLMT